MELILEIISNYLFVKGTPEIKKLNISRQIEENNIPFIGL